MTIRRVLVVFLVVLGLLALMLWATTPTGWAGERRGGKITRWRVKVVQVRQQRLPLSVVRGSRCNHRSRAVEKTMGGNWSDRDIISFYSDVTWRWGGGVVCGTPDVDVWPNTSGWGWQWQGITAKTGPRNFWLGSPPLEHVAMGRWVKFTRGFEWLQQSVMPHIKWVVNGGGGCVIYESGHDVHQKC